MKREEYVYKEFEGGSLLTNVFYQVDDSPTPKPIAIYYHGGGFTVGSKDMLPQPHVDKLLELGFVIVSPNYRLCPTISAYDGPVTDSMDAYNWAQTKLPALLKAAAGIVVDGARTVALGHSCGGTLALLTATQRSPPKAILDLFGMKYLADPFYHTPASSLSHIPPFDAAFLDQVHQDVPPPTSTPPPIGPAGPDLGSARTAWFFSAMKHGTHTSAIIPDGRYERVDPGAAGLFSAAAGGGGVDDGAWGGKGFPPTFFVHGDQDAVVDVKFSRRAHAELTKGGGEARLVVVEGKGHGFDAGAARGDEAFAVVEEGLEFLRAHV